MPIVKVLGIDPSLRNTGLALVSYDDQMKMNDPRAYKVSHCDVLVNPQKFTGKDAILNMIDMMDEASYSQFYIDADNVIIESPAIMFNKQWSMGTISSIAHVAGAAIAVFGTERAHIFRPNEWTKCRKKEVNQHQILAFLGQTETWHFEKKTKNVKLLEHVIDAAGLALWWIRNVYEMGDENE